MLWRIGVRIRTLSTIACVLFVSESSGSKSTL